MAFYWFSDFLGLAQSSSTLQSALIAVVFALSILFLRSTWQKLNVPLSIPGPLRLPFIGCLFVIPRFTLSRGEKREQFRVDMVKKYGSVYQITLFKVTFVFLNDVDSIKEAFVHKGDLISDRAPYTGPISGDRTKGVVQAMFDKDYREKKKLTLHSMKDFGFSGRSLENAVLNEASFLVEQFKEEADGKKATKIHQNLVALAVSNVICIVVFGKRFDYGDAKFQSAVAGIRACFSSTYSFWKRFPIVRHMRFVQELRSKAEKHGADATCFISDEIESHRMEFDPANSPKDFIDLCLRTEEEERNQSMISTVGTEHMVQIITDLFFAGTDTTAASLMWLLLYMMRYPEIQARCQREIDGVPDAEDQLLQGNASRVFPYTTATLLETQRIAAIAPASLPHAVRETTTIGGYRLEKGSLVLANLWYLHMDESYWGDPYAFRPERWLDPKDPSKVLQHSNFMPFSMGKRRCLGENLAKVEYSVFGVTLLRNFTFKMADAGNPPPLEGSSGGIINSPDPYEMVLEKRNP